MDRAPRPIPRRCDKLRRRRAESRDRDRPEDANMRMIGLRAATTLALLSSFVSGAAAQDADAARRWRLHCMAVGGDLSEPAGILLFRRCLADAPAGAAGQTPGPAVNLFAKKSARCHEDAGRPHQRLPGGVDAARRRARRRALRSARRPRAHASGKRRRRLARSARRRSLPQRLRLARGDEVRPCLRRACRSRGGRARQFGGSELTPAVRVVEAEENLDRRRRPGIYVSI